MSDQSRALPDRPSLRYLKLEAKRRLSAGEFATLHHAQLAIAREHGLPSWAALKEHIEAAGPESHALTQVRWVLSRFAAAGTPQWTSPDERELRQHFDDDYLTLLPPDLLTGLLSSVAERLRQDLVGCGPSRCAFAHRWPFCLREGAGLWGLCGVLRTSGIGLSTASARFRPLRAIFLSWSAGGLWRKSAGGPIARSKIWLRVDGSSDWTRRRKSPTLRGAQAGSLAHG